MKILGKVKVLIFFLLENRNLFVCLLTENKILLQHCPSMQFLRRLNINLVVNGSKWIKPQKGQRNLDTCSWVNCEIM